MTAQKSFKITFIQTGGTIDKDYPRTTGGRAFEITGPAVRRILPKLNPVFEFDIHSFSKKDSLEITPDDRRALRHFCQNLPNDRLIITHGTDTLIETANALIGIPEKTIVLTGAMRPEKFADSDAPIHIGMAIAAVQILPPGVFIAMHGAIFDPRHITRNSETGQFVFAENV